MKTLLWFALFAVLAATGYGLSCYTCDDDDIALTDKNDCDDTFERKESLLLMCNATAGENYCRKQKKGVNHVYTTITRACAAMCEEQNVAFVDRVTCCNTDGCNTGSTAKPTILCVTLTAMIYAFTKLA